jgi:hypothetical protein
MAVISLARSALRSRVVREIIGTRTIDIFASLTQSEQAPVANAEGIIPRFFSAILGIGQRLVGFLTKSLFDFGGWLLKNAWDIIVELSFEVLSFDWNQTDIEIQRQIDAGAVQIAGALGNLAGTGTVWFGSVGLAGVLAMKFPILGGQLAIKLAEEGGEEIRGTIANLITVSKSVATRNVVLGTLLTARRMKLFGLAPITTKKEPWTIAEAIENRVEEIDNPALRSFVEQFIESAGEAIIEAGYVASYVFDDYYSASKLASTKQLGQQRAARITPDTRVSGETILLRGPQQTVIQQVQTALVQHQLIHNRDVGEIVGQPAEDWLRGTFQRRKLTLVFKSREKPPWRAGAGEERTKEVTISIPEPKVGLNWQEIKTAARKWTWGRFRAKADLTEGRQMAVYGATSAEAESKLREAIALSTLDILTINVSEEKDRNPTMRKDPTEVYPAYATLLVRKGNLDPTGRTDLSGNTYGEETVRFELWTDSEPVDMPILL